MSAARFSSWCDIIGAVASMQDFPADYNPPYSSVVGKQGAFPGEAGFEDAF